MGVGAAYDLEAMTADMLERLAERLGRAEIIGMPIDRIKHRLAQEIAQIDASGTAKRREPVITQVLRAHGPVARDT